MEFFQGPPLVARCDTLATRCDPPDRVSLNSSPAFRIWPSLRILCNLQLFPVVAPRIRREAAHHRLKCLDHWRLDRAHVGSRADAAIAQDFDFVSGQVGRQLISKKLHLAHVALASVEVVIRHQQGMALCEFDKLMPLHMFGRRKGPGRESDSVIGVGEHDVAPFDRLGGAVEPLVAPKCGMAERMARFAEGLGRVAKKGQPLEELNASRRLIRRLAEMIDQGSVAVLPGWVRDVADVAPVVGVRFVGMPIPNQPHRAARERFELAHEGEFAEVPHVSGVSILHGWSLDYGLVHSHHRQVGAVREGDLERLTSLVALLLVELDSGERCRHFELRKALVDRRLFAGVEDHGSEALARPIGMDEEGADLRRIDAGIEPFVVSCRALVAAERRAALAPSSAGDDSVA